MNNFTWREALPRADYCQASGLCNYTGVILTVQAGLALLNT